MCERSLMPLPPSLMPLPRRREWALARERADGVLEYWTGEWSGDKPTTTPAPTFAMRWNQPVDGAEIGGGLEAFTVTEVFDYRTERSMREPVPTAEPLTLPPVDQARPGQFVQELLGLAERHAAATGAASAAPGLLLAATVAAAERYGQGVGIGVQMIECGGLLRDRTWQRMADQMAQAGGQS